MGWYQSTGLIRDEYYEKSVREMLLADPAMQRLFRRLDSDLKLAGAGVIFVDKYGYSIKVRPAIPSCQPKPIYLLLHEAPPTQRTVDYAVKLRTSERESRLLAESVGALLSCSAAVLGWIVVVSGTAAAPITGGASTAMTVLTWSAATASSVQCAAGVGRSASEVFWEGQHTDWLESQEWYTEVMRALDVISLAGVAGAGLSSFKAYKAVRSVSSRSLLEILKGMTRAERKRLTKEIIRVNHPGISNSVLKQMINSGVSPKTFPHETINAALMLHVKDAVGASFSFTGSATSGVISEMVIGVYEVTL